MARFLVYGIGNPLIDYLVETDDSHLSSMGLPKGGMHLIESKMSSSIRKSLSGKKVTKACGDSTANTLSGLAALGSKTAFMGKAGKDEDGDFYENTLKKEGVHSVMARSDVPTGSCTSFITKDSERTFATHLGACLHLQPEDLDTVYVKDSKCLHLTGYSLEADSLRQSSIKAMKAAKESGAVISLDLADASLIGRIHPTLKSIISDYVTIVFANEKESAAFTGDDDPKEAVRALGKSVNTAVVKVGDKGSFICHEGKVTHIPAFKVDAVDTTGAGDAYNSGFLHGVLNGHDIEKSATLGSFVAAKVVSQVGARLNDENKAAVKAKAAEILSPIHSINKPKGEKSMDVGPNYEVKDMRLAEQGVKNIEWAEKEMGALMKIKERFARDKPLNGLRIGLALHVTKETAVLVRTFIAGGASVAITGCNPLSTQDDVSAALAKEGVAVYAYKGETTEDYYKYLNKVIEFKPHVTIDDGCDLVSEIHVKHAHLIPEIIGGCEETTTGITRLHAMAKDKALKYPMIAVNDNKTKHLLDNYYGTGQSTFDGILRASNVLIAGKTVVVAGYGSCGKGVALRAKGLGAEVIVTEVHPFRGLVARLDGFRVMPMMDAVKLGDIFVTVTGNTSILVKEHLETMKPGAILANSGHFDNEIDVKWLNRECPEAQYPPLVR